jgi:hypothetical protein
MTKLLGRQRGRAGAWLLLLLGWVACGGDPAAKPTAEPVCPTCHKRTGGETADFAPTGTGSGSTRCDTAEAPLTPAVEQAFELEALRAYLASPHTIDAEARDAMPGQPEFDGPVEIEFSFELGEFTFLEAVDEMQEPDCDSVWAPVKLTAEVGDGQISLTASGVVWKLRGHLEAHLYASADLATATGSYAPVLDTSRPHAGQVELAMYVFPQQLRGAVIPEALYFQDEAALQQYLDGDRDVFPDLEALVHLEFPVDACNDNELPLAPGEASALLAGRTPEELREEAFGPLEELTIDAVWRDDSETSVSVELSDSPLLSVCAESSLAPADFGFSGLELVLRMPVVATLRSADGEVELPLDQLSLAVGTENAELRRAHFRAQPAETDGPRLNGWIIYSFRDGAVDADGIVYIEEPDGEEPGNYEWVDCVAFPPGGEWDTGMCRYMR